ncbi:MAG TPA: hypothetical protein VH370_05235 [Humisphaera sp.]|jgi:hypothetical protein|nr:hypothetical protein [Humisphaera sp.]
MMSRILVLLLVAQSAALAQTATQPSKPMTQASSQPSAPAPRQLRAGPISLKLADGELRYIYVGEKEIVRRIYFAVRDGSWNTAMPRFSRCEVEDGGDHFTIHLSAACKLDKVDYAWEATVTGTADGKITFAATGVTNADFASNRIGLCVLYGAPSLKGQSFEAFEQSGPATKGDFPLLVGPPSKLVAQRYQSLRYTTADGRQVSCTVSGATFDMEDQRNWGDSSYKAYAPLRYQYPNLKKGQKQQQTVTLAVTNAPPSASPEPLHLKITSTPLGKLPTFAPSTQFRNAVAFQDISTGRDRFNGAKVVIWLYTPTVHLPDNDTIMENIPTVCDQAKSAKAFAPEASLHVGAALRVPKPNEGRDSRAATPFAASWTLGMLKYLACGNVEETAFDLGPGYSTQVIEAIRPLAGREIVDVETSPHVPLSPSAFAISDEMGVTVWIANRRDEAMKIEVEGLGTAAAAKVLQIDSRAKADAAPAERTERAEDGSLKIHLEPYGVCRIMMAK